MEYNLSYGQFSGVSLDEHDRLRLQRDAQGYVADGEFLSEILEMGSGSVQVAWRTQWTAPQCWEKYAGNPIFGPNQSGAWNSWTNGVSIVPTDEGRRYHMYFAGTSGEGIGFAQASVDDPVHWIEHLTSPVLTPRTDNWEGNLINQPRVVKVTEEHWRMYYTGWGFDGPGSKWALGMAESFDGGITWRRTQDTPILPRGDINSPDGGGACVPMVVKVGERWMMWYTAGQVNPSGQQNIHLCLAYSDDGVTWDKYPGNPILTDDFSDNTVRSVTSRCYVRYDDGVFRLWYSFARPDYRIYYAESLDGICWERSPVAPVLAPSTAPAWDDVMVEYPEIQIVNGVFRLWFCGNNYGSVGYAEGIRETHVDFFTRTGETAVPDDSWSEWKPAELGCIVSSKGYLQVRALLRSENPLLSPAVNMIDVRLVTDVIPHVGVL